MEQAMYDRPNENLSELLPRLPDLPLAGKVQLEAFTATLFEPTDLIELRLIESWEEAGRKRSRLVDRRWLQAHELPRFFPRLREQNVCGANIYFGVNPRTSRFGRKESTSVIRSIWMDMDDVSYDEASARWKPYLPDNPTIIVDSGHGIHAYWALRRPFTIQTDTDRERFARMLKAMYEAIGADSVQDACRVLRLPGFLNVKSLRNGVPPVPCQLLVCDPKRTYPFSTFAPWWERAQEEIAVETVTTRTPPTSPPPLGNPGTRELVAELDRKVSDRSRRDFAIVLGLLRLGLTPEEIWPLVRDKSKFEARGRKYFDLTIHNAMRQLRRTR